MTNKTRSVAERADDKIDDAIRVLCDAVWQRRIPQAEITRRINDHITEMTDESKRYNENTYQ